MTIQTEKLELKLSLRTKNVEKTINPQILAWVTLRYPGYLAGNPYWIYYFLDTFSKTFMKQKKKLWKLKKYRRDTGYQNGNPVESNIIRILFYRHSWNWCQKLKKLKSTEGIPVTCKEAEANTPETNKKKKFRLWIWIRYWSQIGDAFGCVSLT